MRHSPKRTANIVGCWQKSTEITCFVHSLLFDVLILVRYRAAAQGQREGLADENPSEDSLGFSDENVSVVYQMSGQHIKD